MVDAIVGHEALSFMDGFSSYNQIRMASKDEDLTTFCTPKGIYCYKVMPFGLKNVEHLQDLHQVFEQLRRYQLKINPMKCTFGVTSRKFLGFIVRHRGIEIDSSKIDAIQKMLEPRNIHDLKSLQGKLAYIRRFISNLVGHCQPFSCLMKKDAPFEWDEACRMLLRALKNTC